MYLYELKNTTNMTELYELILYYKHKQHNNIFE